VLEVVFFYTVAVKQYVLLAPLNEAFLRCIFGENVAAENALNSPEIQKQVFIFLIPSYGLFISASRTPSDIAILLYHLQICITSCCVG